MTLARTVRIGPATLHVGDCVNILGRLPSGSVDMVFADPPYGLSNDGTTVRSGRRASVNKGEWDRSRGVQADYAFHFAWIRACRQVLAPNGTIWISGTYHSIHLCGYALQVQGWRVLNDIAWFKPNAPPNLGRRMFTASHETLIWASKRRSARHVFHYDDMRGGDFADDRLKSPGKQMRSVWSIAPPAKREKQFGRHPTQKPEALLDRVVRASTDPKGVVLDPFVGSGTTGVAALRHGRRFIGIDRCDDYVSRLCVPRLRAEVARLRLDPD